MSNLVNDLLNLIVVYILILVSVFLLKINRKRLIDNDLVLRYATYIIKFYFVQLHD